MQAEKIVKIIAFYKTNGLMPHSLSRDDSFSQEKSCITWGALYDQNRDIRCC